VTKLQLLLYLINMTLSGRVPTISDLSVAHAQYECVTPLRLLLVREQEPEVWRLVRLHKDHTADRERVNPELIQGRSKDPLKN
jgi:hypothetical protein